MTELPEGFVLDDLPEGFVLDKQQAQQAQPQQKNILGKLADMLQSPGASVRSAIQGTGYTQGAMSPQEIPTFTKMAEQKTEQMGMGILNNPLLKMLMPGMVDPNLLRQAGGLADALTDPVQVLGMIVGARSIKQATSAIEKTGRGVAKATDTSKLGGKVVNQLIRPSQKGYAFGKNPGLGVAKEGLVANNMDSLLNKVNLRTEYLKKAVSTIRATPENVGKTVDLTDSLEPLRKVYGQLSRDPKTHAAEINQIKNIIDDLSGAKLDKVNVAGAYEVKDRVSKMQNWNVSSESAKAIAKAVRQVYHKIDSKIDRAIPELEELNSRMANMISARQAIEHRINVLQNQEPATWSNFLNLPFAIGRSTPMKTLLGKLLARTYKLRK